MGLISFVTIIYALLSDIFIFDEDLSIVDTLAALGILSTTVYIAVEKIKMEKK